MLKQLVLLFAIVAATQANGHWQTVDQVTEDFMDMARWSTTQLAEYTNGVDHTVMTVKNMKRQIVAGVNYMFTLDVIVTSADNKHQVIF